MGKLVLVATPIGNLGDISNRALDVLKSADAIAAEDTRHTLQLLNHFNIKKSLISYHAHSKDDKAMSIIDRIQKGETIAYVSDAGTPCISDPGTDLVKLAHENGICVESIPGANAALVALTLSGMDATSFLFAGFLPGSKPKRREKLSYLLSQTCTCLLYESPHKIKETLDLICEIDPLRLICCCRELTKLHEEVIISTAQEISNNFESVKPRGEFVLVISKSQPTVDVLDDDSRDRLLIDLLNSGMDKSTAAREASSVLGEKRRDIYQRLIQLENEMSE